MFYVSSLDDTIAYYYSYCRRRTLFNAGTRRSQYPHQQKVKSKQYYGHTTLNSTERMVVEIFEEQNFKIISREGYSLQLNIKECNKRGFNASPITTSTKNRAEPYILINLCLVISHKT